MLIALLLALMALPFAGVILASLTSRIPSLQQIYWLWLPLTITLTLAVAWIIRPVQFETVVGNWSPVSFTGTPLVIATNPEGAILLIACLATWLVVTSNGEDKGQDLYRVGAMALVYGAMVITVFANNLITLLIGISLVDLLTMVANMRRMRASDQHARDILFQAASLVLLVIAFALYDATGNSLYSPLARIPGHIMPMITAALALRFCLVPLRAVSDHTNDDPWLDKASLLAGLVFMARLAQFGAPQHRAWFYGLAICTGILALAVSTLSDSRSRLQAGIDTGAMTVALTSTVLWQPGVVMIAAAAWLFGTAVVRATRVPASTGLRTVVTLIKWIGAACLLGLPFTIGFIGRAGVVEFWSVRGLGGMALIAGLAVLQILLTICTLRLTLWIDSPQPVAGSVLARGFIAFALLVAGAHILLLGAASSLAGAPTFSEAFQRTHLAGWLAWLVPTLLGGAAWWFEQRWLHHLTAARDRLMDLFGLRWWQNIVTGAIGRISQPLGGVFIFLESDGALLWAVIVVLIVVLVTRPGGP